MSLNISTGISAESENMSNELLSEDNTVRNTIIIISYSLIIIVSLCGNCLVCKVVYSSKKMRTTTNLLIVSLTVSDLLTTILNLPFNVLRILLQNWPFGEILCIMFPLIQVACVYVSTLTMTVIAVHRWYSVTRRNNDTSRYLSSFKLSIIIVLTWSFAILLALPHSCFNVVVEGMYNNINSLRCRVRYPKIGINLPLWLTMESLLIQYVLPLSVTCVLYIKIAMVISKQGHLANHASDVTIRRHCDAKRKRIVMLVLVVATFAICWLPLNTYHLLYDLKLIEHDYNIFLMCHWFAMSSVCYNPFIYCWLNESFRRGATNMFTLENLSCRKTIVTENGIFDHNGTGHDTPPEETQRVALTCANEQTYV